MLVRINKINDVPLADLPSVMIAIKNIGEELYSSSSKCYGIEMDTATVAFLISHGDEREFIKTQSADLKRHIVELFGVQTTFSLCTEKNASPDNTARIYNNARYAMLYKLSFEPNSLIDYEQTLSMSRQSCEYPSLLEREIFDCIQSKSTTALYNAIDSFIGTIDRMSYDTILLHTARLIIAVDTLVINIVEKDTLVHNSVIEDLSSLESIEDLRKFVRERCLEIMGIISSSKPETKKELVLSSILKFVNENYKDPRITVEFVAANVNRSSNYIRTLFKQTQGVSLSEYINKKRYDQVCKMLIETNLPARDIGKAVGITSGSYFYTSFKKHTGYSPDAYRKLHKTTASL